VCASGRVEPTTVTLSVPATGGLVPSDTVNATSAAVPFGTEGSTWAVTVPPETDVEMPFAPSTSNVSLSLSGSLTYRDRSTTLSSPAATCSVGEPTIFGGWFLDGATSIGTVRTAFRPSSSSGPSPSV